MITANDRHTDDVNGYACAKQIDSDDFGNDVMAMVAILTMMAFPSTMISTTTKARGSPLRCDMLRSHTISPSTQAQASSLEAVEPASTPVPGSSAPRNTPPQTLRREVKKTDTPNSYFKPQN